MIVGISLLFVLKILLSTMIGYLSLIEAYDLDGPHRGKFKLIEVRVANISHMLHYFVLHCS